MTISASFYREQNEKFARTYYYIDGKACLKDRCQQGMLLIIDAEEFTEAFKTRNFIINKVGTGRLMVIPFTEIFVSGQEPIDIVEAIVTYINTTIKEHAAFAHFPYGIMPKFYYQGNYYNNAAYIIFDTRKYSLYEDYGMTSYVMSVMSEPYFCSYLAQLLGYCQNKTDPMSTFSNLVSRNYIGQSVYPTVPIMGHNCKQCGVCFHACAFRKAIKSSMVNARVETDKIDEDGSFAIIDVTTKNQRSRMGEDLEN